MRSKNEVNARLLSIEFGRTCEDNIAIVINDNALKTVFVELLEVGAVAFCGSNAPIEHHFAFLLGSTLWWCKVEVTVQPEIVGVEDVAGVLLLYALPDGALVFLSRVITVGSR